MEILPSVPPQRPALPRRLILLAALLAVCGGVALWNRERPRSGRERAEAAAEKAARAYLDLEAREQAVADSHWRPELDAQRHEDEFLRLWDGLYRTPEPWAVLGQFPWGRVRIPETRGVFELPDGTQARELAAPPGSDTGVLNADSFRHWVGEWAAAGWSLGRTTWTLTGHRPAVASSAAQSQLEVTAQLANESSGERAFLQIRAEVLWGPDVGPTPAIARIDVRNGVLFRRRGPASFSLWFEDVIPAERSIFTDPLLVWDLDGDGFSEIIMVGADRVWRNRLPQPSDRAPFAAEPWLNLPPDRIVAAVRADVNGDGQDDLVLARDNGVWWWSGHRSQGPTRSDPARGWPAPSLLKHPQVITAGDLDGDGDIDLWVAQYKVPYQGGQFPTPWDDANDGFPAYLLRNEGGGRFVDVTEASGLAPERFRRTYSASFVDLDLDGDLDLINISDFAGLDVFLNSGRGVFQSITDQLGASRHAFGMSHVVNDMNGDGRPDLIMLGMNSSVADRLGFLNLEREGSSVRRIQEMTVGNRLYLGRPGAIPLQVAPEPQSRAVARTGWSWGAAWSDFNQDGWLDLAVANGHETRASVRDYERQFWLHDRFVAGSDHDPATDLYFRTAAGRRQADQASYGGWQSNVLLLGNQQHRAADVAWLWGVAVPADCRNLLAEDLDGDGRLDLIVTTQEEWPERRQRLLVFRNELPAKSWIGFRWVGAFPSGARVELETDAGRQTRWLLSGDSYRSQSSSSVHFGLGNARPRSVRWQIPGQAPQSRSEIEANRWHELR